SSNLALQREIEARQWRPEDSTAANPMRPSGREPMQLRPVRIVRGFARHAEGSALIECGETRVLCTASVEDAVPPFLKGTGRGWITAEYGMLPRSTDTRNAREAARGRQSGRTHEIQRLIGRALRASADLAQLGERQITIDCDVLQADGGTRTAAITGGFVALHDALSLLVQRGVLPALPIVDFVAAVSVGIHAGVAVLDLDYAGAPACDTDMNVVMTASGGMVEVQGTAERAPFSQRELDAMLQLARHGIAELVAAQRATLGL